MIARGTRKNLWREKNHVSCTVTSWNRSNYRRGERRSAALAIARVLQKGKGRMEHPALKWQSLKWLRGSDLN